MKVNLITYMKNSKTVKYTILMIVTCIILLVIPSACREIKEFSPIPYIEFVSLTKIDNGTDKDEKGILKIYFTDGDGNIGLENNENDSSFNFFIDYYEKQNGSFVKVDLLSTFNARIPMLNNSDEDKALEGTIEIETYIVNYISTYDTVQLECWLIDRDSNESNHIFTPAFKINK